MRVQILHVLFISRVFRTRMLRQGIVKTCRRTCFKVSRDFTKFGIVGYKIYGSPAGYKLNYILYGSLGGSYKFDQETNGGKMLSLGQKTTTTGSSRMEAIFFVSRKLDKTWKAQGYVLKGFTNSVPDFGAGATIAYQF